MSDYAIHAENVEKTYSLYPPGKAHIIAKLGFTKKTKYKEFSALKNINIDIKKGERIGLVGRNGAGKTTLLKLLLGHIKPTRGRISVNGSIHAMMKADLGFHAHFTGKENALSSLAYSGIYGEKAQELLMDIEEFTELGAYMNQPFMSYSLGMQSRLMFGVASAIKPDILIVDEMLGAGDGYFMSKSAKRMQSLIDNGCTLLLVSHNTQQIMQFCEKAIWIRAGQIYDSGSVRDIINAYDVYIEKETERRHSGLAVTDETDKRQDIKSIEKDAYKTTLEDGKKVYRWPSGKGVKLSGLSLTKNNEQTSTLITGDDAIITLNLTVEETRRFSCRYLITIWDLKGKRIARVENHYDDFEGTIGEKRKIKIDLSPLLIRQGEYTMSISIYDLIDADSTAEGRQTRMDVLAHCIDFNVIEKECPHTRSHTYLDGIWS